MRTELPRLVAALCAGAVCASSHAVAQVKANLLYSFAGGTADGSHPAAMMLPDLSGPSGKVRAFYSTTANGGTADGGVAFRLSPPANGKSKWTEQILTMFGVNGSGTAPGTGGLSANAKRISSKTPLYGSLTDGGAYGYGQIYAITGNQFTRVWDFTGGADGGFPVNFNVVADPSGALFAASGAYGGQSGCGTIDEFIPPGQGQTNWTETTIWTFSGAPDGCQSQGLIEAKDGTLYGTTFAGGSSNLGTAFKLTPPHGNNTAWSEQILWSSRGGTDAIQPDQLTIGANGVLYGTSYFGGTGTACDSGCGTVFQLTPPANGQEAWTEQVLWSFTGGADGRGPFAAVLQDSTGALYSCASRGAQPNNGVIYKLTPPTQGKTAWTEKTLYTFTGTDGAVPDGGLVADGAGVLYGTTVYGGTTGNGAVFSLSGTGFVP